jgi:predicted oxidoreductase
LTEEETFLDLVLKAVIEALRMNPDRYKIIYNSKYDSDDNVSTSTFTKPQDYYYNKYHEGILELAKGFMKILLNQLVDKTMVAAVVKEQ